MENPVIRASGLTRRFGRAMALNDLTFTVPAGRIVGLLGRNGAGKSTFLRILSGQLKQSSGGIELFGERVFDNSRALGRLCLIGDTPDFGGLKNADELFRACASLFPHWDGEEAVRLLRRFELPSKKRLKAFSRGMQTALTLAMGLASGAELTVFDEPSLGLDAVMRERFYDELLEAHARDEGRSFLLSTHLIDEVARTLDCAVMIDTGRLLCEGTIASLTERYLSVSGAPEAVREATRGMEVLKEEELAGSLVRHLRLSSPEDAARLLGDGRVQAAPMSLQRVFVFLTEEREAARDASGM